jgi:hypothetical protein
MNLTSVAEHALAPSHSFDLEHPDLYGRQTQLEQSRSSVAELSATGRDMTTTPMEARRR